MPETTERLGECPTCAVSLPSHRLLIEYETDDGLGRYAECPDCKDVVTPI